jgi:hypothetical protein
MDKHNATYVMGYLRSQQSVEMYMILDQITSNPIKDDFFDTPRREGITNPFRLPSIF